MAKNTRRSFNAPGKIEQRINIALEDKMRLITPEKVICHTLSAPRVRVVALANWEAAPTFVLDEHLGKSFPKVSADRLLNKCNPFLSGKRKVRRDDDIVSEAPTVSTDCSAIPESDVKGQKVDFVEEEVKEKKLSVTPEKQMREVKVTQVSRQCNDPNMVKIQRNKNSQDIKPYKQTSRWSCVGYGRYVKCAVEQKPKVISVKIVECS